MKKTILLSLILMVAFLGNAQENSVVFKNYPTDIIFDLNEDLDSQDTPFSFKNRDDEVFNYLIPVKFKPQKKDGISDVEVKIKSICASYDIKDRLIIYFRGKIDMSCCYESAIALEFYDQNDKLIQIGKTDDLGNFKVKSINGNLLEIRKGKMTFNFSKLKTFDGNADIRFAEIDVYKKPIDQNFNSVTAQKVADSKQK